MKCLRCKSVLDAAAPQTVTAEVKGVPVSFAMTVPACPNCGRLAILGKDMRLYVQRAADAYRQSNRLLTMQAMEHVRRQFGMTQNEFADYLHVGSATYKRWLGGEIQSGAYDVLVRLRTDLNCAKSSTTELMERLMMTTPNAITGGTAMVKKPLRVPVTSEQQLVLQGGAAA